MTEEFVQSRGRQAPATKTEFATAIGPGRNAHAYRPGRRRHLDRTAQNRFRQGDRIQESYCQGVEFFMPVDAGMARSSRSPENILPTMSLMSSARHPPCREPAPA